MSSAGEKTGKVPIPGSERGTLLGAQRIGPADPTEVIKVTVVVRRSASNKSSGVAEKIGSQAVRDRKYPSRQEFASESGASVEDLEKVEQFAEEYGLRVIEASPGRRTVELSGSVDSFSRAFDVQLELFKDPHGDYRVQQGKISIPKGISEIVLSVNGLDNRPVVKPRFR